MQCRSSSRPRADTCAAHSFRKTKPKNDVSKPCDPAVVPKPRPENAVLQLAVLLGNLESLQQPLELGVKMCIAHLLHA